MSWAPLIDTHFHLTEVDYGFSSEEIIDDLPATGIETVIVPGFSFQVCDKIIRLKHKIIDLPIALGLHPLFLSPNLGTIFSWLKTENPVAVGEIGLDRTEKKTDLKEQEKYLRIQLEWSLHLELPVILHCVHAHDVMLRILSDYPGISGVVHRVSSSWEIARKYLNMGLYFGIGPEVCHPRFTKMRMLASRLPSTRILLETDSPFTTGVIYERSKPSDLRLINLALGEIRNEDPQILSHTIYQNTHSAFPGLSQSK